MRQRQREHEVRHAEQAARLLRPFDETHRAPVEIFAKAGIGPFGRIGKAVQIEVIDVERAAGRIERIGLDSV